MLKKEIPTAVPSFNNARLGTHLNEIDAISSHVPVEQISFMMRISNIFNQLCQLCDLSISCIFKSSVKNLLSIAV
jgi:hypothetical protein